MCHKCMCNIIISCAILPYSCSFFCNIFVIYRLINLIHKPLSLFIAISAIYIFTFMIFSTIHLDYALSPQEPLMLLLAVGLPMHTISCFAPPILCIFVHISFLFFLILYFLIFSLALKCMCRSSPS